MPTPTKGPRLGGSPTHERMILAGLASQLFEHGRITTTETKAKRMRPLAEKLITKAKRGDLHARRLVLSTIHDKSVVHKLFTEIAPAVAEREGGYLRITKIGNRKGDNAPMATVELVTESVADGRAAKDKVAKKAAKPTTPAAKPAAKTDQAAAAEKTETVVEPVEVPETSAAAVPAAETPVAEEATVVETNLAEAPVDEAPVKGEQPAGGATSAEAVEVKPEA